MAGLHDHRRLMADPGLFHVLGDREGVRPLDRPAGPLAARGLAREAWGKGYATEGSAAAMGWAFGYLGWTEVIHTIDPDNLPSHAVARRLGSRPLRPGKLPPPLEAMPIHVWGQSRQDWLDRRR